MNKFTNTLIAIETTIYSPLNASVIATANAMGLSRTSTNVSIFCLKGLVMVALLLSGLMLPYIVLTLALATFLWLLDIHLVAGITHTYRVDGKGRIIGKLRTGIVHNDFEGRRDSEGRFIDEDCIMPLS